MASVDDARSIEGASDEMWDHICGPCKIHNVKKEAKHYCVDCGEMLCSPCKDYHRKLPKNHEIISSNQIPTPRSTTGRHDSGLVFYCSCNKNQEIEFYCDQHKEVFCNPCKNIKHHKCTSFTVQEKSRCYTTAMLDSILLKTKVLKEKYERLRQERSKANTDLVQMKEGCKKAVQAFRKDLDTFINQLEQNMLKDIDKFSSKAEEQVNQQILTLTTASQRIDSDYKLLETAKKDGTKESLFLLEVRVSKNLLGYESRLADLKIEITNPNLSFKRNKQLADIQANVTELGFINMANMSTRKILLDREVQSQNKVNVKTSDDTQTPCIVGSAVLPGGHIVLCDPNNQKLKLYDMSWKLRGNLKLSSCPFDVSVIDDNHSIISLPEKKQLQHIQVFPSFKPGQVIQLDRNCWGVCMLDGEIYTTCHDSPGQGEIKILDQSGNLRKRVDINQDLNRPYYCSVSQTGRIYVSNGDPSFVICMTADGNILYKYTDKDLKRPLGMFVDADDNLLVCGRTTNNVQVVTADGRKFTTLLSANDGIKKPYSIAQRKDGTLVVGCRDDANVFVFTLAQ